MSCSRRENLSTALTEFVVERCLTSRCSECSGAYVSAILRIEVRCSCPCHTNMKKGATERTEASENIASVGKNNIESKLSTKCASNFKQLNRKGDYISHDDDRTGLGGYA